MSRARDKGLRLFVAVYPPQPTARALLEALEAVELPAHRLVPPEQVHLTLHFIGNTPARRLGEVTERIRRSAGGLEAFELRPGRLITLPERGRRRLVAAAADAPPALLELQRRLAAKLARAPRRRPGDRFRPHLTLCRFRSPAAMPPLDEPLDVEPFPVRSVLLMKSVLDPGGARHDEAASIPLAG